MGRNRFIMVLWRSHRNVEKMTMLWYMMETVLWYHMTSFLIPFVSAKKKDQQFPCTEAIFRCEDAENTCANISIPREDVVRTQTPHTYPIGKLLWAHEEAAKRGITNTAASCVLMQELGETVYFSSGSEKNLKITTVDDMQIFKALLHVEG